MADRPFGLCAGEFPDPQDAADAMTREAQERGEYDSPLSSIPDLIEMIRRERDELRELHRAAEERISGCGHRRVDWADSYGGCVACSALAAMHGIDEIRRERDEARADNARLRRHLTDALGDADRHEANHTLAVCTMQAWKARAESAERKLTNRAQCCVENEDRLRPRDARVEPPDTVTPVLLHVAMGMGQTWVPVTLANDEFEPRWFAISTTRVYSMSQSPYWLPMPPAPEEKP